MTTPLTRLDNNLWGYTPQQGTDTLQQIQIQTPTIDGLGNAFKLASAVGLAFDTLKINSLSQLKPGFYINLSQEDAPLKGRWKVTLLPTQTLWERIKGYFPFFAIYPNQKIAKVSIVKDDPWFPNIRKLFTLSIESKMQLPDLQTTFDATAQTFQDAFTKLAATAFQTVDPNYVSEQKVIASYRYVLSPDGTLSLSPLPNRPFTDAEKLENQLAATAFCDYVVSQFGQSKIDYINSAYGFSLDQIIANGDALVPDHVFKVNTGVCDVTLSDVESLVTRLYTLNTMLQTNPETTIYSSGLFCNKELEGLQQLVNSYGSAQNFLSAILPPQPIPIRTFSPNIFNQLVTIVMPSTDALQLAFTGRKITHLAICGYNTMGNQNIYNPSRNVFELRHVFEQMKQTTSWTNYYELLAHVASKKSLFQATPPNGGKVGILLPAPNAEDGTARWYYVDSFIDDGEGDVNYVLLAACNGYLENGKPLPCIINIRSTASNGNAIDSMESVAADMNPYGAPGSLKPKIALQIEKSYFDDRTIPLWVVQLLQAQKQKSKKLFKDAMKEYLDCIHAPGNPPPEKVVKAHALHDSDDHSGIEAFLLSEATLLKELPENKIAEDIACIGHSLGGTLAQFLLYYFGARRHRMPLPGCIYTCFSTHGTAIDTYQDRIFMGFGRKYRDLIAAQGAPWQVYEQMEFGDFIPEVGESHLGTTGYNQALDSIWLNMQQVVFRPEQSAQSLDITTMPTHGRRTGNATEGLDYTQTTLSVPELSEYDHDLWMPESILDLFGYRILRSSKLSEFGRELGSLITWPFWQVAIKIIDLRPTILGKRNPDGSIVLKYQPT